MQSAPSGSERVLQLGVDELVAEDVGQDEDGVLGALVLGVRDVGVVCGDV